MNCIKRNLICSVLLSFAAFVHAQPSDNSLPQVRLWCDTIFAQMDVKEAAQTIAEQGDKYINEQQLDQALVCFYFLNAHNTSGKMACISFNLAHIYAQLKNKDSAFKYLKIERQIGKCPVLQYLDIISDFQFLKPDERWKDIVKIKAMNRQDSISNQLSDMLIKEQEARTKLVEWREKEHGDSSEYHALVKEMALVDSLNSMLIKTILKEIGGFPSKKTYGAQACMAAFTILQHVAWDEPDKNLKLIKKAYENGDVEPQMWALFYDRYQIVNDKKQLYGSQAKWNKEKKCYEPFPIEDEKNVNTRRKQMGMQTIEEYFKQVNKYENSK